MLKNFYKLPRIAVLLAMLFLLGSATKGYASHYAAVDIKVDFVGNDSTQLKYLVTLTVYKACTGVGTGQASLSVNETVSWRSLNAPFNSSRSIASPTEDTIDNLCPIFSAQNSCRSTSNVHKGYTRRIYADTVTLPSRQTDWVFYWSSGTRNSTILNLNTPTSLNIYVECVLNNTGKHWGNSSPRYLVDPFPFICQGQLKQYINGPFDPDNDSLRTYANVPLTGGPWTTAAQIPGPLYYTPPQQANPGYATSVHNVGASYTNANPINSTTPYAVNPTTGTASFTPLNTGQFVLGFRTDQYDKETGEYLGRVLRDAQVAVVPCASPPPVLDTVPQMDVNYPGGRVGNVLSICPNLPVIFTVSTRAAVGSNYIKLSAQVKPPTAFFSTAVSGGSTVGTFSWTPTTADIGTHVIVLKAEDTTCTAGQSIILDNTIVVTIRVLPGIDAGPDKLSCPLGDRSIPISVSGPTGNQYVWTRYNNGVTGPAEFIDCLNCPNVVVSPPGNYTYVVTTTNSDYICKLSDTVVVAVDNSNSVVATQDPLTVCRPGYVHLNADGVGPNPVQNLPCGILNPINCSTPDVRQIGTTGNPAFDVNNTPFFSFSKYHKYQFIITKEEMKNSGIYSGTLKSIAFKHNNPTLLSAGPLNNIRISLKCTRNTKYPTLPTNVDFETGTTLVATVPGLALIANAWNEIPFTTPYNWDTTQNLLVDICMGDAAFVPNAVGTDPVDMVPGQALQRVSAGSDVCAANGTNVFVYRQRPVVRFGYCIAPDLPFQFQWAPGTYLADSNVQSPIAYVPRSGKYTVYTWGRNGCKVVDTLRITVPIHNIGLTADTNVCVFQPAPLYARGASAGYRWYENGFNTPTTLSCNDCASPISTPVVPGDITYTVVFLDTADCYDTLQIKVHAYPLPIVNISTRDTTIKFGQSVPLLVNGANRYTWTPVGSLNDPNIPNPIASPTVTTRYVVFGLNQYNCSSSDTVTVKVDNRDNLLIPSGFTPNWDGKNDYFRIVNVTFQKLMEFRVFNRWGQEVFTTTDPLKGWDGTWKGVAQDLGNYSYIIRVAYPDGYVETYKGEVTLIR